MLSLSVVALVFPALFHSVHPEAAARMSELHMSEAVSVILIVTYALSLLFTLRTHRSLFGGEAHPMDGPVWKPGKAILILAAATVGVAIESELLVHAATEAGEALGFSSVFLGLIIIPIIGNAAEHAAAVMLSRKGQIDLGLQIALGSSTQIALLVAPLLVFAGRPDGPGHEPRVPAVRGRWPSGWPPSSPPSSPWTASRTGSRGSSSWRSTGWWRSGHSF